MEKSVLDRFIAKYNLGGAAEAVTLTVKNNKLSTKFRTDDQHAFGYITAEAVEIEGGEYGIYDTKQLISMLKVLGSEVEVDVIERNNTPTSLMFRDDYTKVTYALADIDNIPKAPTPKKMPTFDFKAHINQRFLKTFVKAQSALADSEHFTVSCEDDEASFTLGYSGRNSNRINLTIDPMESTTLDPISFRADYLREMFVANKEMDYATLYVSSQGISKVTFKISDFEVEYYLGAIQS